jgi:hypothetical protein
LLQTFQVTHLHQSVVFYFQIKEHSHYVQRSLRELYVPVTWSVWSPHGSVSDFAMSSYLCHNFVEIIRRENAWEKQVEEGIQRRERQEAGQSPLYSAIGCPRNINPLDSLSG